VAPRCLVAVADAEGRTIWDNPVSAHRVLDARVSYLMVSLLESVINRGTAAGVRARGFNLPAAGKTGTSHDGWFAGFTTSLLAVVWVGYDDDRDLNLTGAQSALPVWTEFMKRTSGLALYKASTPFNRPEGIETAEIDNRTNLVAAADPALTHSEVFITGTEPFPPVEEAPAAIAMGPGVQPGPTVVGMGSLLQADKLGPGVQPDPTLVGMGSLLRGDKLGPGVQPDPTLVGMGSFLQADKIALTTDAQGHEVYLKAGALFRPAPPTPSASPHAPTPPSAP